MFIYIIVHFLKGNIKIYRLPKGYGMDQNIHMAQAAGQDYINVAVHTLAQGLSIYLDISLYNTKYHVVISKPMKQSKTNLI